MNVYPEKCPTTSSAVIASPAVTCGTRRTLKRPLTPARDPAGSAGSARRSDTAALAPSHTPEKMIVVARAARPGGALRPPRLRP